MEWSETKGTSLDLFAINVVNSRVMKGPRGGKCNIPKQSIRNTVCDICRKG